MNQVSSGRWEPCHPMHRPGYRGRLGQSPGTGLGMTGLGGCTRTQGPGPWHGMERQVPGKLAR